MKVKISSKTSKSVVDLTVNSKKLEVQVSFKAKGLVIHDVVKEENDITIIKTPELANFVNDVTIPYSKGAYFIHYRLIEQCKFEATKLGGKDGYKFTIRPYET